MSLGLVSCGNNSVAKNSSNVSTPKVEKIFYENLNSKDKKKMVFKFKENQDETRDNTADTVYIVSMKVKNQTKKSVKFDKSKFLIFVNEQVKFKSSKKGILNIKPGKSVTIHQLFENIPEQALVGGGSQFIYLNKNNKLSDANFAIKNKNDVVKNDNNQDNTSNSNTSSYTNSNDTNNGETSNTSSDDTADNQVATGDDYDDSNPTKGWDESNLDPNHDGKRLDRIIAWSEHYKQVGLDQGMSDEDAQSYGTNIAQEKENEYEASGQ